MEKLRGRTHFGEIYLLFPKVLVEYFVRDRKAANSLQFLVSEKTQAVLEFPGVTWKVTKSKFYVALSGI